jgi:type I restriction enzyme, S subunit
MDSIPLNDPNNFELLSGLWKGERAPFMRGHVIRGTNFSGDGLLDFTDIVDLEIEEKKFSTRKLRNGDIIVERSGGGPKQPVGRVSLFSAPDDKTYFSSNFTTTIRILKREVFDPEYVAIYLHALYAEGATETLQRATTGIRNLDWHEYLQFEIPTRPLPEQKIIANIIGGVRSTYRYEQNQIETSQDLKNAAMRQLFTRGVRQGEAHDPHAEIFSLERLDKCAKVISTRMSYSELQAIANGQGIEVLGIKVSDMNRNGNETELVSASTMRTVDANIAKARCAPPGTIVFPKRGAAIATNKKRMTTTWTVFDPNVIGVSPGPSINPRYLFHWFQHFDLRTITEPGPTPQLNKKHLDPLLISIPETKGEQDEIAEILDAIDRKIDLHKRKRAVLEELFRSLLHKLMTGEIDVNDLDLSALPAAHA